MPVQVKVLGTIEVVRAGRVIPLAGQGQRTLFAALTLEHGRVVTTDRLVDILWGPKPPASARTRIQAHISAIRQAMGQPGRRGAGPVLTAASGYALSDDGVQIDLASFDRLTASGRAASESGQHAAASELFAAALALWRGPAFADITTPAIRAAAGSVDERRVLAVEAKAEADLVTGRCDIVVAELSAWLIALPLRERLRALLMTGLYELGCRADALNLYLEGRRLMIAELGLEPGPQLRDLHQRILVGDRPPRRERARGEQDSDSAYSHLAPLRDAPAAPRRPAAASLRRLATGRSCLS
jgi:DNA-binding SARP family transcriptional activator